MSKKLLRQILGRIPRVAHRYRSVRDTLDRYEPAIASPWGFAIAGNRQMASGKFEPLETRVVRDLLGDSDLMVNVGANVGYYCCHALQLGKQVIAIEPVHRNLRYLLRNVVENGWASRIEVFPVALAAGHGVQTMWGGGTGASLIRGWAGVSDGYTDNVPTLALDRVVGDRLAGRRALILVDVEGGEYALLQGAFNTLRHRPRPRWIVEINAHQHQPSGVAVSPTWQQTFECFFDCGYRAKTVDGQGRDVGIDYVRAVALGQAKSECHNFLFE